MPRITLISAALLALINVSAFANDADVDDIVAETQEIDPIVTGQTVNDDYIEEWETLREKYLECGNCAIEPQPYPEELD